MSVEDFISRLTVLFGPPETVDDDAFIGELRDMFGLYEDEILRRAGNTLRSEHTLRGWPTFGEINDAVRGSAHFVMSNKRQPPATGSAYVEQTPEAKERVQAMVQQLVQTTAASAVPDHPIPDVELKDVSRPAFEKMQSESRNHGLHRKPDGLTDRSRRMMGDE